MILQSWLASELQISFFVQIILPTKYLLDYMVD